ncbi:MAG: rhomboid family intramembrane serine protease [Smithella sp.]
MAPQVIFFAIVILSAIVTASADLSRFSSLDVSMVMSGEIWRMLTGHLTHLTWQHYALDAPVFFIVYLAYKRNSNGLNSLYLIVFSALVVSSTVIIAGIHQVYGGLSGLSYAAISAILLNMLVSTPRRILPYLLTFALLLYLFFLQGSTTGINGINVAKEAHLAGILSGGIFELIRIRLNKLLHKA